MLEAQAGAGTRSQSRGELGIAVHCTVAGPPKHATQFMMKASEQVLASKLGSGMASTHQVNLSMMDNRYTWPSEEVGRGPIRSRCT
jgi:hypothetical protein